MLQTPTKTCKKCGVEQPLSSFHAHKKLGRNPRCKGCRTEDHRAYYRANRDKFAAYKARARGETPEEREARIERRRQEAPQREFLRRRKSYLKVTFGITPEEYEGMLATQGGKCAICGTVDPGRSSPYFHVDHCHATNKVRGLLCNGCNLGLGHFKDDVGRLRAAVTYLGAQ